MASISDLRTGIATNLATISGLRTSATVPDSVNPPIAVVMPNSINYDTSFARTGGDDHEFIVLVIVGRVEERTAQNTLDAFCSGTGASSIKTAIESDKTLGGKALTLRCTQLRNYNQLTVGDITYLSGEFVVQVIA